MVADSGRLLVMEALGSHRVWGTGQTQPVGAARGRSGLKVAWIEVEVAEVLAQEHLEQTMGQVEAVSLGAPLGEHLEEPWAVEGPLVVGVCS